MIEWMLRIWFSAWIRDNKIDDRLIIYLSNKHLNSARGWRHKYILYMFAYCNNRYRIIHGAIKYNELGRKLLKQLNEMELNSKARMEAALKQFKDSNK